MNPFSTTFNSLRYNWWRIRLPILLAGSTLPRVNRNHNMAVLKEYGKKISKLERKIGDGRLDFAMCNFCGDIVDDNLTVVHMYEDTQLKMIR